MASNSTTKKRALSGIKSISILLPVLGVTWVFGFLSISDDVIVFEYIFAILNSFQGFFIFISKCLLNKKIRKAFIRKLCKSKTERSRSKLFTLESDNTRSSYIRDSSYESSIKEDNRTEHINEDLVKGIAFNFKESTDL
ncbi:adhesion G-protein coupled receptor D1-like [Saccostrea cucullata]|uniref:adhesion G-protein coupled receptor D1-like n=1 Tax=Saccostrea cuccullata TaxID=36930 RepID=UPI002ED3D28F